VRQIVARFFENLYDFDSAFLRTWLGLTLRPGQVCREYIQGRRKTYMNPFGYFLLAVTATVVVEAITSRFRTRVPGAAENTDFHTTLLLTLLVPYAVIWSKLFRRQGLNLAENYVFALYVLGHFVWIELLILVPVSLVVSEWILIVLYLLIATIYVTLAATVFYRESIGMVTLKLLLSNIVVGIVIMLTLAVGMSIGLVPEN
jgi:hypothetical protein